MTSAATTSSSRAASRALDGQHRVAPRRSRRHGVTSRCACNRPHARRGRLLGGYVDWRGCTREIVTRPGSGGSVLVLDRDAATRGDRRLVAHLAPDEPPGNAELASCCYLDQARLGRCRCRALTSDDLLAVPFADEAAGQFVVDRAPEHCLIAETAPVDGRGRRYGIEPLAAGMSIPELRWCRLGGVQPDRRLHPISVRDAIAALDSYEPVRALTTRAIARHRDDDAVSVAALRAELTRVNESPIVLNRALREAVLAVVERDAVSMSEIAMRCARVKRDAAGNESGETSWLARRLGLLPEGGRDTPTRWIHTDVLALIARDGLGISPREVEVE